MSASLSPSDASTPSETEVALARKEYEELKKIPKNEHTDDQKRRYRNAKKILLASKESKKRSSSGGDSGERGMTRYESTLSAISVASVSDAGGEASRESGGGDANEGSIVSDKSTTKSSKPKQAEMKAILPEEDYREWKAERKLLLDKEEEDVA